MDTGGRATQEQLPRKQERAGSPFFWILFFGEAQNYRILILHSEAARRVKAMDGFHERKVSRQQAKQKLTKKIKI